MVSLGWCKKQKKGMELVEPNDRLFEAYFNDAEESLEAMGINKGKWKVVTAYYACYHALYALLMKIGIKSEIHECTLELMEMIGFDLWDIDFLKRLKKDRIEAQYYLRIVPATDSLKVKQFLQACRLLARSLNEDQIIKLRGLVKNG